VVRAAKVGTDKGISHIAPALIHKYITDLQQLGLLWTPSSARGGNPFGHTWHSGAVASTVAVG